MTTIIRGGRVFDPANNFDLLADILIQNGSIAAISDKIDSDDADHVFDANGCFVTPGFVDCHVHFRQPGQSSKEDFNSGSAAAIAGGFTSVATMPNTLPVVDNAIVLRDLLQRAHRAPIHIHIIGALTKNQQGELLADLRDMVDAGVLAFSDDGHFVDNPQIFLNALDYLRGTGKRVICHDEDSTLVAAGSMHEGPQSALWGFKGRPSCAEDIAVARDILLADYAGAPLHIAHISSKRAVEIVRFAKQLGINVTAECTPQHLTLTQQNINPSNPAFKINPPLRSQADCDALLAGLLDGTIDAIATDHSPHSTLDKDCDFSAAPSGFSGLETCFGVLFTDLFLTDKIDLLTLFAKLTCGPAKVFGLDAGTLAIGKPADIAIINPNLLWTVCPDSFLSKGKLSPFAYRTLQGKVVATFVAGNCLFRDDSFLGDYDAL